MNTKLVKLSITLDGLISGWCRSRQGIDWNIISEIIKKEFGINIIFDEREFVFQLGERDKLRYQILLRLVSQFSRIDSRVTVSSSEEYTFDYDSKIGDNELSKLVNMSNICQDQILKIRG